ncbi:MAG: hypothetical protein M5U28_07350 [Sandaracinaceae bacterium]|nr:hypothetical protein [Sandaracinaceae bacterium]
MRIVLASLLALAAFSGCGDDDDAPPPPPVEQAPAPVVPAPPTAPAAPTPAAPVAQAPPSAPPQLAGAYELLWNDDASGSRFSMPDSLLAQIPGCIWARWGWEFGEDGRVTVSNRLLCRAPPDFGRSHGVCHAEFATAVQWRPNGMVLAAPTSASSRFVLMERHGQARDTSTVRCNVRLGTLDATFVDVVPGPAPNRPQELTLALADGGRMRLRAVDAADVDYGTLIDRLDR